VANCITCGSELHPERAKKYNYCTAPDCQEKNLKGLTMVAIGINKSSEAYLLLDEQTQEALASGKFRDQRRGSFGTSLPSSGSIDASSGGASAGARTAGPAGQTKKARAARQEPSPQRRRSWSRSAEKLAILYNEQGMRPAEIAQKLGLSSYDVTQIILASRNRGKL
jgi:adenine-specific DNA methylase